MSGSQCRLLIPIALAGGGKFRTLQPSLHMQTNIGVMKRFLDVEIDTVQSSPDDWLVEI